MRKRMWLLAAFVAAMAGTYLASGFLGGLDSLGQIWIRDHLAVVQEQLASLKHHLQEYKRVHGRYPTNDEGLGALDNFESRFTADFPGDDESLWVVMRNFYNPPHTMERAMIGWYREAHGHVPRNAEEFRLEPLWTHGWKLPEREESGAGTVEIAIAEGDHVFLITSAGVMTPWLVPYVYENREGLEAGKFAGSPAERDRTGRWSVKVDEGVYVYSVGGERLARRLAWTWWRDNGPKFAGVGLLVVAAVLVVIGRYFREVVAAGMVGAVASLMGVTCYAMGTLFSRRDPEMVREQRELLGAYRERGVITDATYEKAMEGLKERD